MKKTRRKKIISLFVAATFAWWIFTMIFSSLAIGQPSGAPVSESPSKTESTVKSTSTTQKVEAQCVLETEIVGAIGAATLDHVKRSRARAEKNKCGAILFLINTPGGNLQTTRMIVEEILASDIPVFCMVYPSGGHAGSAGAIILQACHKSGAVPTSNIGAATPISGTGENIPEDLKKKMVNDTVAWVQSLAKLRGRSEAFAKDIIEQAKSVSADEALKLKAIEFVGDTKADFIKAFDGQKIALKENVEVTFKSGEMYPFPLDVRFKIMDLLMNPQVAYLLFMGSLGLLYYELTHPGMVGPGVIGGIGLIISLVSLHMLDATWGAALLIFVGIGFMIAEAFVPGFGLLGIGGTAAFFVGSIFLFDFEQTGYSLPMQIILPTTIAMGAVMLGIAYLAFSTRKLRKHGGADDFAGRSAQVTEVQPGDGTFGYVDIDGELWRCTSDAPMHKGETVYVKENKGLTLIVSKNQQQEKV